jgi:tRNA G10  N-methylase Trm11
MKYLFILGRNIELSIAEIQSYFRKIGNELLNCEQNKNSLLVEVEKKLDKGTIDKLGGAIAIGEVLCLVNDKELEKQNIYSGTKNNITYAIWNFSKGNSYNKLSGYLKSRFKEERLKASEKNLNGSLQLQTGEHVRIASGLIDEEYFVSGNYFGKIIEKCNDEALESKDMNKPVRREALSISPRLAKIMINLSEVKPGEKLLDPFCGIGVILLESLSQGIKVVGVDRDDEAVKGAVKNLNWSKYYKSDYKIINDDSKKVKLENVNVIVTEPDLGEIFKSMPSGEKAFAVISKYENLIVGVLRNLSNKVSGRIVFTAPLIKTGNKRISCNVQKILQQTKLKLVSGFPIQEYRENQIVSRNIFVVYR